MTEQHRQLAQAPRAEETSGAAWIEEMHDHFRQNGFYRAEDLQRVLGDPCDHVEVQTSDEPVTNFMSRKRGCETG